MKLLNASQILVRSHVKFIRHEKFETATKAQEKEEEEEEIQLSHFIVRVCNERDKEWHRKVHSCLF